MSDLFPKRQILDYSKRKAFADHSFRFNENGEKFFERVENAVGKGEITSYEEFLCFPHRVFKRRLPQIHKTKDCLGKGSDMMHLMKNNPVPMQVAHIHICAMLREKGVQDKPHVTIRLSESACVVTYMYLVPAC